MTQPPFDAQLDRSFARLTDAERRILAHLAEGHTVKSISSTTGWSVASVNERLREARRKTGVGSSRELARILRSRENRDEYFVMANPDQPTSFPDVPSAPPKRGPVSKGKIAMPIMIFGALVIATLAAQTSTAPVTRAQDRVAPAQGDPRLGTLLDSTPDLSPHEQHHRLSSEPRDAAWAPATEAMLHARYAALPHFADGAKSLRIECRTTVCEVVGTVAPKKASAKDVNIIMDELQSKSLNDTMASAGLSSPSAMFGPDKAFVYYWERTGR